MVDLILTSTGGQYSQTPLIGESTPAGATTSSSASSSPTPPASGLFPFQEINLIGLGLNLPQSPDDCAALAAEVSLLLQASLAKNHEEGASVMATGLEADLENAQAILAQITTLQTNSAAAQAAATKDQATITQDQSEVKTAQAKVTTDKSNVVTLNQQISADETSLHALAPNDPGRAGLETQISADRRSVNLDTKDEATQNSDISKLNSDITTTQTDLNKQNAVVSSDTAQIGALQTGFLQAFRVLVSAYMQLNSAQNGARSGDNQNLDGVLKNLDGLPLKMASVRSVLDTSLLNVQEQRDHDERNQGQAHPGINDVAAGFAAGIIELFANLQDLVPQVNGDPHEAAILRGQRLALFA